MWKSFLSFIILFTFCTETFPLTDHDDATTVLDNWFSCKALLLLYSSKVTSFLSSRTAPSVLSEYKAFSRVFLTGQCWQFLILLNFEDYDLGAEYSFVQHRLMPQCFLGLFLNIWMNFVYLKVNIWVSLLKPEQKKKSFNIINLNAY